ncbi:MAG: glycosyltransferase, partial [Spirochaetaceae bacterium]|nr:glycosyltransferase [Spirochaetaceae bacterium]
GVPLIFSPQPSADVAAYRRGMDERYPQLAGKRLLVFAGRVTEEKDVKFLLPVLAKLDAARGDVALAIAGDGPYRQKLQEETAKTGLQDKIAFMGYVPRTDLPLVYAAADVFVFPSKTETQGLCTIEAMATGTPVVAIGEMGTKDVMGGDHGGFMVKNDVDEFAQATLKLLGDNELRRAKSEEAIAWSKRYRIDEVTDELLELYRHVAAARKPRELRAWIESKRKAWRDRER